MPDQKKEEPPFPVPNPTTLSFWHAAHPDDISTHRSTPSLPPETDILIIGAGYAGASLAHHILGLEEAGRGQKIVVLEARETGSGATGRNGGHIKPDPFMRPSAVLASHGAAAAEEVAAFETRQLREIGALVEGMECEFVGTRVVDVWLYEAGMEGKLEGLREAGVVSSGDVWFVDGEDSGVKGAKGAFSYPAGHLYPYKLVAQLLSKAVAAGVNLQTHTPVTSVSEEPDAQGRWKVETPRGSIAAKKVIYASNAYTSAILPEFKEKIVPVRGICSRIVTPRSPPPPLKSGSYILRFNDWEYDYLIGRGDGSIIVGGARRDYYGDLDSWFGVHDDSTLIESAKNYFDGYMQRHFVGWEDSEARTERVWTGIMGYSCDGFPFVGEVPGKAGQFLCAGFSGHGMPQVFLSAKAVAGMVVEGKGVGEVDLPLVYRATRERLESKERHVSLKAYDAFEEARRSGG